MTADSAKDITHVIQLAIAPVFLLTAVGATLNVLTARLARVVDRGRALEAGAPSASLGGARAELFTVEKRARWILWGMSLGTLSGIQVSLLIGIAFVGYALDFSIGRWLAVLFVGAMAAYTGALICILREVYLATLGFRLKAPDTAPPRAN